MAESPSTPSGKRGDFFVVQGEHVVLKSDGRWFSNGTEITHRKTCEAFFKNVGFDEVLKKFYVHIGYERLFIDVEDTAFFVQAVSGSTLHFSNEKSYTAKDCVFTYNPAKPALYVTSPLNERARCLRDIHYSLLSKFDEKKSTIQLDGESISIAILK